MNLSNLWLSCEEWTESGADPEDEIIDVLATLSDGSRWSATICTYKHVESLRKISLLSGECLSGKYFWAANLILAADTLRPTVEALIADLLATKEFYNAFCRLDPTGNYSNTHARI
jgi:hypothetical protein